MPQRLDRVLPVGERPRVVVVGDLILDEYLRGEVDRISPEAPVPVLDSGLVQQALGGAANVAQNLAALGCDVSLAGVVGEDAAGATLLGLCEDAGIDTIAVARVPSRPTSHKTRVVARGQHVLRIDREQKSPVDGGLGPSARDALGAAIDRAEGVILSDYKKGVLTPELVEFVLDRAQGRGIPVTVDPKGSDPTLYKGVALITPNLKELRELTGAPVETDTELRAAAQRLREQTGAGLILVTRGRDGMVLFEGENESARIATEALEVYDVTGAGDTVVAVASLALFRGVGALEAARLANAAAGLVVEKLGTATATREELLHHIAGRRLATEKVLDLDALRAALELERAHGKRIVFTNGCFDLLHAGHVGYLQAARDLGEVLVVGLNSDASVRELKGEGRPIVEAVDRAALLSALACVSYVTLFDDPTPLRLIEAVEPDVLVKGADYKPEDVVGRKEVEAAGGRLELVPLVEGQSSSQIIASIVERFR